MRDTEIPLFVQYNWRYQKSGNLNFLLKERDIEIRDNATKVSPRTLFFFFFFSLSTHKLYCHLFQEFYLGMSKTKLESLLESLQMQEDQSIEGIRGKYEQQAAQYKQALQDAKAKA